MRLKKVELIGFKSFAEKISLSFDAHIMALVGPNGCGKSNIVDAILWVLGEQSAKSLRAEKMHDVLFSGSDEFKSANFAEVSLTLSEVDHPVFGDEVTITRRLYRDGEMRYIINQKEARLKDVQDLFLGSGMGKNALFVFEQGKIDEIINLTPEKRRVIFEETAGISKFLQKKKETYTNLKEVEQNYLRLKDINIEIEKRLVSLKKQSEKAKSYKENKARLDELEHFILLFQLEEVNESIESLTKCLGEIEKKSGDVEEKNGKVESLLDALKKEEEENHNKRSALQKTWFELQNLDQLFTQELNSIEESFVKIQERNKKNLLEQEKMALEKTIFAKELKEHEKNRQALEKEKVALEKEERVKSEAFSKLESGIFSFIDEEKNLSKALLEQVQKESGVSSKLQEKTLKKEAIVESIKTMEKELKACLEATSSLETSVAKKKEEVDVYKKQIELEKNELEKHLKEGKKGEDALTIKKQEKAKCLADITETAIREKTLLQLQEERAGFSSGAKALLKEVKNKKSSLYQKAEELYMHVEATSFSLVTTKSYQEILVVKEEEDFEEIFKVAKKNKWGSFSLILVKNIPNLLKKMPKVHQEGIFIDEKNVIFYQGEEEKGVFDRISELEEKKKKLLLLNNEKQVLDEEIKVLEASKSLWEASKLTLEERRQKKEMKLLEENFFLQRLQEDLKRKKEQAELYEREKTGHEKSGAKLEVEIEFLSKELAMVSLEKSKMHKKMGELEIKLKGQKENLDEKLLDLNKVKLSLSSLYTKIRGVEERCHILKIKSEEGEKREGSIVLEIEESESLHSELEKRKETIFQEKKALLKKKQSLEEEQADFEKSLKDEKEKKKLLEQELGELKKRQKEVDKESHKIQLQLTNKKAALDQFTKEVAKFSTLRSLPSHFFLQEAEREVKRLNFELESVSDGINLASIEECEIEEKRFLEQDVQLRDLEESQKELHNIISKLEGESRRLFKATFEQVRLNFQKNFQILFQGGEGDLIYTQENDILEGGVEIVAKPPGKKLRSLSLLSGGEKCLTTVALLLALFEVRPAPFCILDEIDAPLDETNVGRFTTLLKEFISKTQFIIVTHNKKTMAAADGLIGVSMEKRGVSKLVTLSFAKMNEKSEPTYAYRNS